MSYSNAHEASNLRTYAFEGGAQRLGGRVALLRCLRPPSLADTFSQPHHERSPWIAENLRCGQQTVSKAIHEFNERGLDALKQGTSHPREVHAAFDEQSARALQEMLHQDPRKFGKDGTLWTLEYAAQVSFEKGLTQRRVSAQTIRATLVRLGVRWQRAKRWIESPDPEYERKRGSRDRLIRLAKAHPEWVLGFEDESWFSRFERPSVHNRSIFRFFVCP